MIGAPSRAEVEERILRMLRRFDEEPRIVLRPATAGRIANALNLERLLESLPTEEVSVRIVASRLRRLWATRRVQYVPARQLWLGPLWAMPWWPQRDQAAQSKPPT